MGKKKPSNPLTIEKIKEKKKLYRQKLKEKRARLIVRNLPFTTTEENLRKHFEQFGEILDVTLLKKPDGKLVGCGFIQFKLVQKAAKARHHANKKPFLGREIECDWALAKDKYKETADKQKETMTVKEEVDDGIKKEIKEEPVDPDDKTNEFGSVKVKVEETCDSEGNTAVKTENEDERGNTEDVNTKSESDDDESSNKKEEIEDDEDEDNKDDEMEENEDEEVEESDEEKDIKDSEFGDANEDKKPRVVSNDVVEGKTVFIRNVPFEATNEDLKECMRQFGPTYYALICIDKFTEHSKGTAFVKFQNKEDADKCLQAGTELKLLGNILDCHPALSKNDVQAKANERKQQNQGPRDSRNLYLVKEGVVLAGTKAAENVSASDMAKRLQLEQYKTQMLRNLNMFISRERLIIHNIPATWDDAKLRTLLQKHAGPKATIKESRVMRDLKNVDADGIGKSKEFGFVTFSRHEDALRALRSLNNNPNVFSAHKRPIVAFSIENKKMVKAKQQRVINSRLKNPNCKSYDPNARVFDRKIDGNKGKLEKLDKKTENKKRKFDQIDDDNGERQKYAGVAAKPGVMKMRSKFNLKTQARLHHENLKKQKKRAKMGKKTLQQKKKEFIRQPMQKINKNANKVDDSFSKMVSSYKQKILGGPVDKKPKWYE